MKKLSLIASCLLISLPTFADVNPTLTLKGGYQFASDMTFDNGSPDGGLVGLSGELMLSDSFSIDLGYQYHGALDTKDYSIESQFIESKLGYQYLLNEQIYGYGKLGVAYWQSDKEHLKQTDSQYGVSPIAEIGMGYYFTPHFRAALGYQFIGNIGDSGSYDSHSVVTTISYLFKPFKAKSQTQSMPVNVRAFSFEVEDDKTDLSQKQLNELVYLAKHSMYKQIEIISANGVAVYEVMQALGTSGISPAVLKPVLNSDDTNAVTIKFIF